MNSAKEPLRIWRASAWRICEPIYSPGIHCFATQKAACSQDALRRAYRRHQSFQQRIWDSPQGCPVDATPLRKCTKPSVLVSCMTRLGHLMREVPERCGRPTNMVQASYETPLSQKPKYWYSPTLDVFWIQRELATAVAIVLFTEPSLS